jgi:integrase
VLRISIEVGGELARAKRPHRLPVVLTATEATAVLEQMIRVTRLMASLLYGSGLRLNECTHLRAKDVDFERLEITVRDGRGRRDRMTMLPQSLRRRASRHTDKLGEQEIRIQLTVCAHEG